MKTYGKIICITVIIISIIFLFTNSNTKEFAMAFCKAMSAG